MSSEDFYNKFKYMSEYNDYKKLDEMIEMIENEKDKDLLMMYSAMFHNLDFIKYLVDKGFDIHCENDYVFEISCNHNYPDITRYVISLSNGYHYINEALVSYAHIGDIEFVDEMLGLGGDIMHRGHEAIYFAGKYGHKKMVEFLIENGADADARPL